MPHPHHDADLWAVEGRFQHLIFSPKGGIEGLLIDTAGVATQFVTDPHDTAIAQAVQGLRKGQTLMIEGSLREPSDKGEPAHTVYDFARLATIDGKAPKEESDAAAIAGKVIRFNYAKHGAPNGVVLDSGDFIHTRPDGFERLGLQVGDRVEVEGKVTGRLAVGAGRVVEAHRVNGLAVREH